MRFPEDMIINQGGINKALGVVPGPITGADMLRPAHTQTQQLTSSSSSVFSSLPEKPVFFFFF